VENMPVFRVHPRKTQPKYRSGKEFAARCPTRGPYWWLGSPKSAPPMLVSTLEHSGDGPLNDPIGQSESRLDLYVVADDAATWIVEQGAFVPPDAVPPSGRRFTKATLVWQSDQFNAVAVDGNEAEQPNERRDLPVDAANRRHRGPDL
jgi:hypothetical protein